MDIVARKSASVPSLPVKKLTSCPKSVVSCQSLGDWDRQDSGEWDSKGRQIDLRAAGEMSLHHSESSSASVPWADDDYWMSWDLWDEEIDWDEEERSAPAPRVPELRSPSHPPS